MSTVTPRSAEAIAGDSTTATTPLEWDDVLGRLARVGNYWLATVDPDGQPTVRPVFGVVVDGTFHTTSNPAARKARNLSRDARCTVSGEGDGVHLVVEGTAAEVRDAAALERVAAAYHEKYHWPVTVVDGAFDAPFGAPTAGPPPYVVRAITPVVSYAFGMSDDTHARTTRFRF